MGLQDWIDENLLPASTDPATEGDQPMYGKGPYAARYGLREDGTPKGEGYYGKVARPNNPANFSTELSTSTSDFAQNGKDVLHPLMVPGLTKQELDNLVAGGTPTQAVYDKALDHARMRVAQGKSPFADKGEQGHSPLGMTSTALPTPPPGYAPGPTAPVRMQQEDSLWGGVLNYMRGLGVDNGTQIPVSVRMKIAQQEADLAKSNNELAWKNYQDNHLLTEASLRRQNREAVEHAQSLFPNIKAQLSMVENPEERQKLTNSYSRIIEGMSPGSGEFIQFFNKNMASVYAGDDTLSSDDPNVSGPARQLVNQMGYEKYMMSPQRIALAEVQNRDRAHSVAAHMPLPIQQQMVSEKGIKEEDFRAAYKAALFDMQLRPVSQAAANQFLNTPAGEEFMVGMGVKTNKLEIAHQKKMKDLSPIDRAKTEDFQRVEAELKTPEKFSPAYLTELKETRARYLGQMQKEGSPGESPNSMFSRELLALTGGNHRLAGDLDKMIPGSPEHARLLNAITVANQKVANYSAQAQLSAQMQKPADMATADMYDLKALREGKLEPVLTPMSTGGKLTSTNLIHLDKDEKEKFNKIRMSQLSGMQLFDLADKAYPATTALGTQAQVAKEIALRNPFTGAAVGASNPELKLYNDEKNAWAGNNAKALGGEVGVLTNIDITRWADTFPNASDSPKVRKLKRKMFNNMVGYVRDIAIEVTAGKKPADYVYSQEHRSKVEGMLGALEGINKSSSLEADAEKKGAEKLSPAEQLRQEMLKGK